MFKSLEIPDVQWTKLAAAVSRQAGSLHLDSVHTKLHDLHQRVRLRHPLVDSISFALYDPRERVLKGLPDFSGGVSLSPAFGKPLSAQPILSELATSRKPRVTNDLHAELASGCEHTLWLYARGYRSDLTVPVDSEGQLLGFLFFNARVPGAFPAAVVDDLLLLAYLIGVVVKQELASLEMLIGSLRLARQFAHLRDIETGAHLDRMSRYAHLIAREVAPAEGLGEDFVELLHLFAPLHDIGKVGVPDHILHKPGPLDADERLVMDSHVPLGVAMANRLLGDFGLQDIASVGMLHNVIAFHHELIDGSGYPGRLRAHEIPLESRIVAAADVFDALSCRRSYKPAWSLDDAFTEVRRISGSKLDESCVHALLNCRDEVEAIHQASHEASM